MRLTVIGCGDAFGSGGRLQSTFLLEIGDRKVLLECGATASIGLTRAGVDANAIDTILISHLHGDHFAGVVWMILSAQYLLKRTTPLRVVGPPGIAARYEIIAEALFPGMTKVERRFDLTFDEITPARPFADADLQVAAVEVSHPSGAPSYTPCGSKAVGTRSAFPAIRSGSKHWSKWQTAPICSSPSAVPSTGRRSSISTGARSNRICRASPRAASC